MKVKFVPQNVEFEIKPGESVMHLAEDNGIYVKSVCRGVPSCAECRVRIVEGETNMFQPVAAELALIGSGWFIDRRRLSCQLQCIGDVTVDMSEQIAKQQGLIGGRKAKAAKALGDRVEDETVIRESTAGGGRSGGRSQDRDVEENDRDENDRDENDPDENERVENDRGQNSRGRSKNSLRPQPPKSNVVIGGSAPRPQPSKIEPRREGDTLGSPSSIAPAAPGGTSGGISPVGSSGGSSAPQGEGGGRSGRSRRGGRGRR